MRRMTEKQAIIMSEFLDKVFEGKTLPLDDKNTYDMIASGDTDDIFMMESDWDKYDLLQIKPQNMEELTAAITFSHSYDLNPYIYTYIKRTHLQPFTFPVYTHIPEVDNILMETHGVLLYNEQKDSINKVIEELSNEEKDKYKIPIAIIHHEMKLHRTSSKAFFSKRALLCYKLAYMKTNMLDDFYDLLKKIHNGN